MGHRFEVLDGMRGLAAILVALYHFEVLGFVYHIDFIRNSYLFVEFFFVLSGFVIAHGYRNITGFSSAGRFIVKRIARLWPLHMVVTCMYIPFAIIAAYYAYDIGERFSFNSFLSNTFLLQALGMHQSATWNVPSWSISVEFYVYVLFAALSAAGVLKKSVWVPAFVALFGAVVLMCKSDFADFHHYAYFRGVYSFFLGILAYKLFNKVTLHPLLEVFAVLLLVGFLGFSRINAEGWLVYLFPLLACFIVLVFSYQAGIVSKALKAPALLWLGNISFSVYLTHAWFITCAKALSQLLEQKLGAGFVNQVSGVSFFDFGLGVFNDLVYLAYIALVFFVSHLTYRFIEKPAQQKLNAHFLRTPALAKPQ